MKPSMLAAGLILLGTPAAAIAQAAVQVPAPPAAAPLPLEASTMEAWFAEKARAGFAGIVLIAQGDRILLRGATGPADVSGRAFTPDTVFDIGSLTKQFTAAAILLLEQEGRLSVDDPVSKFLPQAPADKAGITLHQLLTHSAGLGDVHGGDLEPVDRPEALSRIFAQTLLFEPGAKVTYSNSGYTLLAAVIEEASGQPFLDFMRARVLEPHGLDHTGVFGESRWNGAAVAHGFINDEDTGNPAGWPGPYWTVMGNGEWLSTADDLLRWHRALTDGRVIAPDHAARLWAPHRPEARGAWGYGWRRKATQLGAIVEHGGVGNGGNAEFVWVPEHDLRIIVYSNRVTMRTFPGRRQIDLPGREVRDELLDRLAPAAAR